ncbi:MAG: hypothetical protein ACK4UJ_03270 [Leptonema sp. (in: bacteria)]
MKTLLWLQAGDCSGDSMSLLNSESPDISTFFEMNNVELLWHPSLSPRTPLEVMNLVEDIKQNKIHLNFLCIEGAVLHGPENTGMFDTFLNIPKKNIIKDLAENSDYVIAVGTCATFGGIIATEPNPTDAIGMQFLKNVKWLATT